jgi:DNA-binding NtrC family response regulator
VIETREFMRLGAETVRSVDVRIIGATNKDLQREVDAGRFREDLYFRLKAVTLNIPPLRNRKADIPNLANHFINSYALANRRKPPFITDDAMQVLENYSWPGNIRELKNTIETAVALNKSGVLEAGAFASLYSEPQIDMSSRNLPVYLKRSPEEVDRELMYRALFEIKKDLIELKDLIYARQNEVYNESSKNSKEIIPLDELEKEAIQNALDVTRGNKRNAAKLLKISERTLYRKIKEYDIK